MKVRFKKLRENAKVPTRATTNSAGYDLYSTNDKVVYIDSEDTVEFKIGIAVELPDGYFGAVVARSGLSTKRGLRPANCFGVVDSDYRGEVIVALHNDTDACESIHEGDRIAQLVILPYLPVILREVEKLTDTDRGAGGFGSTGVSSEPEYEQLSLF